MKFIDDSECDCCVGLGKEYAAIDCEECNGTGTVTQKTAKMRSLYNKLLRRKRDEQIQG